MAATSLPRKIAASISYTYTTDSVSDWDSVPVSTYFFDKDTELVYYKDSLGTVLPIYYTGEYTYEIGQYVASEGGVIAHRWLSTSAGGSPTAGTVQNYLVLDTTDLSLSAEWATINVDISNVESTWNGATNTANLIVAGAVGGITSGTAAVLCDNSTNEGKSDWYLPAIDELNKVWDNRWEIAQGLTIATGTQLAFDNYWSSSEFNVQYAFLFSFTNGDFTDALKGDLFSVRAMRKFSIQ